MNQSAEEIVSFWLSAGPTKWFVKDETFDDEIREQFADLVIQACTGKLASWLDDARSALALVILLDQFPRNIHRGAAQAFSSDELALKVAEEALAKGFDGGLAPELRQFLYMPFMHSEDLEMQERCVALCKVGGTEENVKFAEEHADIVRRFGRFPHRNNILGRASTEDEIAFLKDGGFAG